MNYNKEYTLKCTLGTRTNQKTGKDYEIVILKIGDYEKYVYFERAELQLLKERCK